MGPNGSGKSTLSSVLVGNPAFEGNERFGDFEGKDLLALSPEDRSHEGLFCLSNIRWRFPVSQYGELYACGGKRAA